MPKILKQLRDTYKDLSLRWGTLGSVGIITLAIASVVANILQILSYFPDNQTITIPLAPVAILAIVVVSAVASLALQIRQSDVVVKRRGKTELTNVFVVPASGELYYGDIRNVLVRLGTIQQILLGALLINNDPEGKGKDMLKETGRKIGVAFGDQFVDQQGMRMIKTLPEMIDRWCEYDVEAGWGRFIHIPGSTDFVGSFRLRSNFLTASEGNLSLDHSLCRFIEGYISGVLDVFMTFEHPSKDLSVEVTEQECGVKDGGRTPCAFTYVIKNSR